MMKEFKGSFLKREDFVQYNISEKAAEAYNGCEDGVYVDDNGKIYIFDRGLVQTQSLITICDSWDEVSKFYEEQEVE